MLTLEDIERATNPRPKEGRKSLSQEQLNLRNLMLGALDTVRDESDKDAPVRLVLDSAVGMLGAAVIASGHHGAMPGSPRPRRG